MILTIKVEREADQYVVTVDTVERDYMLDRVCKDINGVEYVIGKAVVMALEEHFTPWG